MKRGYLVRKQNQQNQQKRFLIVVEGAVTEVDYINAVRCSRRIRSAAVVVEPPGPTSPLEIVKKADKIRKQNNKNDPFDEVWCVFDVEANLTQTARLRLNDALSFARQKGIKIALSNPCFELWILLHHEDRKAWIASNAAQQRCSELGLVIEKKIQDVEALLRQHNAARDRAHCLSAMHDRDGRTDPAQRNPLSDVYLLVDSIYSAFPKER